MNRRRGTGSLAIAVFGLAMACSVSPAAVADDPSWRMAGHDKSNTRHQADEKRIKPGNVASLATKWIVATDGDVSATPAVADGALYVPDWAGKLYKLDAHTGAQIWKIALPAVSRATPTLVGNKLIVPLLGLPAGQTCAGAPGACVLAINAATGAILWESRIDDFPIAYATQSPVVEDGRVYVGVTSAEESLAGFVPGYPCCSFQGSVVALDAHTGAMIWKTYTVPSGAGLPAGARYSGAAVWGSTPVVDKQRGSLYITTGNNYDVPVAVKSCFELIGLPSCETATDNHVDAVVAFDLATGAVKWAKSFAGTSGYNWPAALIGYDAWNLSCIAFIFPGGNTTNCPNPVGPDYDFAQGPMLLKTRVGGRTRDMLVAGQKSGVFWALDPDSGSVIWGTVTGPGGVAGGMQWGSATDGTRIYFANANSGSVPVTINGVNTTSGFWGALDAATGTILWRTADPNLLSGAYGPVTVANGVVFAGSNGGPSPLFTGGTVPWDHRTAPTMFALDAQTGEVKWTHAAGGSVLAGAAVVDGVVYWGSGYANFGVGIDNKKLFAFELR